MNHIELGKQGENLAIEYYKKQGRTLVATNYRFHKGEVDLIVRDENSLIFVEVKTRKSDYYGSPSLAVSRQKQRQIIKVANAFIQENQLDLDVQFDVIAIVLNSYETSIEHIPNAFYPL